MLDEDSEIDAMYQRLLSEWGSAEEAIKKVERIQNAVFIPSVKELRYAGRRVVDALNGNRPGKAS